MNFTGFHRRASFFCKKIPNFTENVTTVKSSIRLVPNGFCLTGHVVGVIHVGPSGQL